jgi:sugar (pentulose or hexulose) kinase
MTTRSYLGIDLGTTSFKGAILDLEALSFRGFRQIAAPGCVGGLPSTRHELSPAAVIETARNLIGGLLRDAPEAVGLLLCGQMHGVVLVDDRGRTQSNIVTWKDQRAVEPVSTGEVNLLESLRRRLTPAELDEIGGELRPGVPIVTLAALRSEGLVSKGLFAASLCDFVVANLAERPPTTDPTNAAATGLYDLDRRAWHKELIGKLGLDSLRWAEIRSFQDVAAEIEIEGRRLTCFTPIGDQQCALAGTALAESELSLNISTGSQVSLIGRDRPRGNFLVRPYFDGRWLRTIVSVPAGRALRLLVDLLTELGGRDSDPWDRVRGAVERVAETDLDVDLSFFASLAGGQGHIANIHEGNLSAGHLFLAAFRSMAANYSRCTAVLSPAHDWNRIVFSGGLALRLPRLRREILGRLANPPHRVGASEEDTIRGLLSVALVCEGRAPTIEEAARMPAPSS